MIQYSNLPSRRNEDWLYTSLKSLETEEFKISSGSESSVSREQIQAHLEQYLLPEAFALVFVDGQFSKEFSSDQDQMPKGLSWKPKSESLAKGESFLSQMRAQAHFESYNLELAGATSVSIPLQIHFLATEVSSLSQVEISVNIHAQSKICFLESTSSLQAKSLQNISLKFQVAESARLEYVRLQMDHLESFSFAETQFSLSKFAQLESLSLSLGGLISRHELHVQVLGPDASAQIHGLSLGSGSQHHDHHTLIDHRVGGSTTEQLYKSVLNHKARSVFTGKVMIQKFAQKASSDQLNKNLLLSREAQADSRPQLEVLADDVKATHGSTVGQLQEEEIFYLLSRAIPRRQAIEMLSLGFVEDLIFRVSNLKFQKFLQQKIRVYDLQGQAL